MVTDAIKREILRLDALGYKPRAIRVELGLTRGTVAGILDRYRTKQAPKNVLQFPSLPKPQVVTRPENESTDTQAWISQRDALLKKHEYIRVMHMNDVHFPYHDEAALDLWFEIAARFQPQIVALGDDDNDYPTISSFEPDRDIKVGDWQIQTREYHWPLVERLNYILPNALFVYLLGNHNRRALKAIKASDSPQIGMEYYIDTIRANGRVLYVGRTEHVEIGQLVIAHGNKAGKYAAANIGAMWPDKTVNFGHIHRHQVIGNAFSNGMLCQKTPHYDDWGYPNTQEQGTSTMTVCSSGGVAWSHHNFIESKHGLFTQYGNEIISVGRTQAESEAA
jgi:hypothetical protein